MRLADWLRERREQREGGKLSQDLLAVEARKIDPKSGVHQNRLSEWEKGERSDGRPARPSLRQLEVVGLALGLSSDQMREGRRLWVREELGDLSIRNLHGGPPEGYAEQSEDIASDGGAA